MNISDIIMNEILSSITDEGFATIRRNEFAERLGCVPSQINYVITSRFTPEKGYTVSSRRGGGGFITITKIGLSEDDLLTGALNSVGERCDERTVRIILENLIYNGVISEKNGSLILGGASDISLKEVPTEKRDRVRATIVKNMLLIAR